MSLVPSMVNHLDGNTLMEEKQFWSIIEAHGTDSSGDADEQLDSVRNELLKLSPAEVQDFDRLFNQKRDDAYIWDLWGAAYLINGGCSDDAFHYFRAWLISQGRAVYYAAVANPDTLAGLTDPERDDYEFESLGYVALEVYEQLTGSEMPHDDIRAPSVAKGENWDFEDDDEVIRHLPKLGRVYLD